MRSRNVPILTVSQALAFSGPPMIVLLGGIIGADLAPSPSLATLPISILVVGVALSTIPAALLMKKFGRRRGFVAAAIVAGLAALLATYSLATSSFFLFCAAVLLIGTNGAFVQQFRFAAAESVEARYAGRAVSFVMVGGIVGGFLGPEIVKRTQGWLGAEAYTASFVSLAMLYAVAAILLSFLKDVTPQAQEAAGEERPLREIVARPGYLVAVLAGAVAYGVMSFVMTATPVHLHRGQGYSLDQTAWVIQSHVIAMYLPSLFTGLLLERLGATRVMLAGVAGLFACVLLAIASRELIHFWEALVLLGVGWNLLFVGATVLLTRSYRPTERFKAQATNDFTIFAIQSFASLSAGTVLFRANWEILNLINLPFLALTLAAIIMIHRRIALAPGRA